MNDLIPSWYSGIFGGQQSTGPGSGTGLPLREEFGGFGAMAPVDAQQQAGPGGWGDMGLAGRMGVVSQGLGAFTSLANLYGMFKNLGFQKKAFKFAQEGTKRNFNANAQAFNNAVDDQYANRKAFAEYNGGDFHNSGIFDQRKIKEWG